jgi:protocatechuate 3,4-dioxygenase beta subunit
MADHPTHTTERSLSRRGALAKLGGIAAGAMGASVWGGHELLDADEAEAAGTGPAAVESGLVSCVLTPEMTEGPYYVEGDKVRRNITEGKAGAPLALRLTVLDVSTCKPIKNAAVDIWHCDAGGLYSEEAALSTESLTFLRGIQRTDKNGVALFKTIYPGWYSGRTVHVHLKVYLGGRTVHTGQLFFSDALTDVVYRRSPYSQRPSRDVRNASDSIFRNGGKRSLLKLRQSGTGYVGTIAMGVQRS